MNWFLSVIDGDSLDQSELVNIKIFNFHFILLKAKKKKKRSQPTNLQFKSIKSF